jgi:hypothetical protein
MNMAMKAKLVAKIQACTSILREDHRFPPLDVMWALVCWSIER